jgi:hypothetical protein
LAAANSNADLKSNLGVARVYNKCDKPVYLWSVKKDQGCDQSRMIKLEPGAAPYEEKYRDEGDDIGVSIKISWTEQCKGSLARGENVDITQLEYHINHAPGFNHNYLDVSFVDCLGGTCPGRDKFCLKSGNNGDDRLATAGADKAICPILKCNSKEECATMAYILPDDVQTKSCEPAADMDFYLCSDSYEHDEKPQKPKEEVKVEEEKPKSSSQPKEEKPAAPTSIAVPSKAHDVSASEITPAPEEQPQEPRVKTEVVYVTEYATIEQKKRHAHGHRHKHFRA